MRAAILQDGVVVNILVVYSLDQLPGAIDASDAVIGDKWDGAKFIKAPPPPPAVPQRVPMLNAHLVLIEVGWMPEVEAFIEMMPEPDRTLARAYLAQSLTMARDHDLVKAIPNALGKTEEEVDDLFVRAGALNV